MPKTTAKTRARTRGIAPGGEVSQWRLRVLDQLIDLQPKGGEGNARHAILMAAVELSSDLLVMAYDAEQVAVYLETIAQRIREGKSVPPDSTTCASGVR